MFEVGKFYIEPQQKDAYECTHVAKAHAILYRKSCNHELVAYTSCNWEEYVPPKPLTFADLKVGEKFKWKCPSVFLSSSVAIKAKLGYIYTDTWQFWNVYNRNEVQFDDVLISVINDLTHNLEVIRCD